jgi:predicted site-specific integrase-resolvase
MNLAVWAERNGVARVTAYRWFNAGLLPVPAQGMGRLILVNDTAAATARRRRTAVYARVSSADQKADLNRQVARVTAWATAEQIPVDEVVTDAEVDDDLVRDMTEILTSMSARLYGKRAAAHRAQRAVAAAADAGEREVA